MPNFASVLFIPALSRNIEYTVITIEPTLPTLLSRKLPAVLQFLVSLKQEGSASLATWHVQIPGKIITELSVHCSNHQELEHEQGDLVGAHIPPG